MFSMSDYQMSDSSFKADTQASMVEMSSKKQNFHFRFITGVKLSSEQGTTTDSYQAVARQVVLKVVRCIIVAQLIHEDGSIRHR